MARAADAAPRRRFERDTAALAEAGADRAGVQRALAALGLDRADAVRAAQAGAEDLFPRRDGISARIERTVDDVCVGTRLQIAKWLEGPHADLTTTAALKRAVMTLGADAARTMDTLPQGAASQCTTYNPRAQAALAQAGLFLLAAARSSSSSTHLC